MKLTILIDIVGVMLSKGKSNPVFLKLKEMGITLQGKMKRRRVVMNCRMSKFVNQ